MGLLAPVITDPRALAIGAAAVAASPTIWNVVARNEYRRRTITRLLGGRSRPAAYGMAAWIFLSSLYRDYLFDAAVAANPHPLISPGAAAGPGLASLLLGGAGGAGPLAALELCGAATLAAGAVLVLSSMWRLGVTGTYLGDYFGIFMSERVSAFPFNVMENPMYNGATMCFLGRALMQNSLVGVGLSAWVFAVYQVATVCFEGPFTTMIYRNLAEGKVDGEQEEEKKVR